jgi:hypothetical protein
VVFFGVVFRLRFPEARGFGGHNNLDPRLRVDAILSL